MFENWSLSQFITRFVSINNWVIGIFLVVFGFLFIFVKSTFIGTFGSALSVTGAQGLLVFMGGLFLVCGLYSCIMACGLWKFKNYGRIMLLIQLYISGAGAIIYFIIALTILFKVGLVGLLPLIISIYFMFIVYMIIYLFQVQKDMVALFKSN